MGSVYGGEAEKETPSDTSDEAEETTSDEEGNESPEREKEPSEPISEKERVKNEGSDTENAEAESAARPPSVLMPEGEATSSATFFARVFTGEGSYPVQGAKVVLYRGDNIYSFLETDENGRTKTVKLPAFAESNSLEPDNENQSISYNADVFAESFTPQKGLLVSAVGGSEIVLNVLLVPQEERLG